MPNVEQLTAKIELDDSGLQQASRRVSGALEKISRGMVGLNRAFQLVDPATKRYISTQAALNAVGVQTTSQIREQIAALNVLIEKARGDIVATNQLIEAKKRLQSQLQGAAQGVGRTNDALLSLSFILNDVQQFSFGFSQGIRSISNNLGPLVTQLRNMQGGLGGLLSALRGPLGVVVALEAASTAAVLFGDKLVGSLRKGKEEAERLKKAVSGAIDAVVSFDSALPGVKITPDNIGKVIEVVRAEVERLQKLDLSEFRENALRQLLSQARKQEGKRKVQASLDDLRASRENLKLNTELLERLLEQAKQFELIKKLNEQIGSLGATINNQLRDRVALLSKATGRGPASTAPVSPRSPGVGDLRLPGGSLADAVANVQALDAKLLETTTSIDAVTAALRERLTVASLEFTDTLTHGIGNVVTGFQSFRELLSDVSTSLRSVVRDIIAAAARAAILSGILSKIPGLGISSSFGSNFVGALFGFSPRSAAPPSATATLQGIRGAARPVVHLQGNLSVDMQQLRFYLSENASMSRS